MIVQMLLDIQADTFGILAKLAILDSRESLA